ncbi:WD40-repeat-containing domain protein [Powellomyces hirtus]|nr:WD40-repeat-containing domain protein [Powellomyces hirtus]
MKRTRDETPQIGEDQSIPGSPCSSVGTQTVKALKFDRNELPEISKEDAFRTFRLRRIVRENHGGSINSCSFFNVRKDRNAGDASNIMATVGAAQVNFYDNEHCGDHLDIMSHFVVGGSGYPKGETERPTEELKTAAWMTSEDDLVLAVAGSAGNIHLLSLTQSKELSCWEAHPEGISHLEAHPSDPNLLLSVGSGYRVRLWHVDTKKPLCEYHVKAASAAFHPNGRSFLTTGIKGLVHDWEVPEEYIGMSDDEALKVEERIVGGHAGGDYTSSKETKPRCQAGPYTFHTQRIGELCERVRRE